MGEHTPYQKKIIRRYYEQSENIGYQRLSELTGEIYLAEGKKLDKLWEQVAKALAKVELPASRIQHVLKQRDPRLLAELVKELTGRK